MCFRESSSNPVPVPVENRARKALFSVTQPSTSGSRVPTSYATNDASLPHLLGKIDRSSRLLLARRPKNQPPLQPALLRPDSNACCRSRHYRASGFTNSAGRSHAQSWFFSEKDSSGQRIDYHLAINGEICLTPADEARVALQKDYEAMVEEGLFLNDPVPFSELMAKCSNLEVERTANTSIREC